MAKKREDLTVRVTYEPNRFSSTHLMNAYESLAPIDPYYPQNENLSDSSPVSAGNNYDDNK